MLIKNNPQDADQESSRDGRAQPHQQDWGMWAAGLPEAVQSQHVTPSSTVGTVVLV